MADPPKSPTHPDAQEAERARRSRRESARTVAAVLLAVLLAIFAVLNLGQVSVNWIFGSGHAPLIVVIVISLVVGILLTYVAERRVRGRR
jgi:uncharacterized integral membrane protein